MLHLHLKYALFHKVFRIELKPLLLKSALRYTLKILMTQVQQLQLFHICLQLLHRIHVSFPIISLVLKRMPIKYMIYKGLNTIYVPFEIEGE